MALLVLALAWGLSACGDEEPPAADDLPARPEATERPDPRLRLRLEARAHSTDPWTQTVRARPRQLLRFRAIIRNLGEAAARGRARVELERGLGLVGISTYLRRGDDRTGGTPLEPGLTQQGVVLGSVPAGATRLAFSLRVAPSAEPGSRLTVGASVSAQARRAADTAVVRVVPAARSE